MLQAELGADFTRQLHQHVDERRAVRAGLPRLLLGPVELVQNALLDALQTLSGGDLLLDHLTVPSRAPRRGR